VKLLAAVLTTALLLGGLTCAQDSIGDWQGSINPGSEQ